MLPGMGAQVEFEVVFSAGLSNPVLSGFLRIAIPSWQIPHRLDLAVENCRVFDMRPKDDEAFANQPFDQSIQFGLINETRFFQR